MAVKKSSTFLEIFRSDVESFISEDSGANVSCVIRISFELPNSSSSSIFSLALKNYLERLFLSIFLTLKLIFLVKNEFPQSHRPRRKSGSWSPSICQSFALKVYAKKYIELRATVAYRIQFGSRNQQLRPRER